MARACKVEKEEKRKKLVKRYEVQRAACRKTINDQSTSMEEKFAAQKKMQSLPRDSSRSRLRNRCLLTGRSRGVYRRFGLGRHKLREYAMTGLIPGLRKASW